MKMKATKVSLDIEHIKVDQNFETYREACLHYLDVCEDDLDFPDLAKLLSPALRQKLEKEAIDDGFMREVNTGDLNDFIGDQLSP